MCVLGLLALLGGVCIVVGAKIKKEVGLIVFLKIISEVEMIYHR